MAGHLLRIAFLHLAPVPGAVSQNRHLLTQAITKAACSGAGWIITPELAVSGYTFADTLGTDWIEPQPDHWMSRICRLAARFRVTLFLSHPERDPRSQQLYNAVFAIGPDGRLAGSHRKINALRVGSEAWSTPGTEATAFRLAPFGGVGLLICADAYTPGIAKSLKAQGAKVLVSSAAWAPGLHGPNGEWERCTNDTGLPLFVCNRTGQDRTLDFRTAESVVAQGGKRLLSLSCEQSAIFLFDWNLTTGTLASADYQRLLISQHSL
ncbi:MAG: carbon-nitrogen hydrolase family protein [Nitrospira sp.]|nr:carbon-nitrogen hydrolase family protein [Nitrospira sp.]